MKIYSIDNKNTFKAVAINSKTTINLGLKTQKLAEESISKINETIKEGALQKAKKLSAQLDAITVEMNVRRKVEDEKPWYKSRKYSEIDRMEATQKQAIINKQAIILSEAENENKISEEIKNEYNKNANLEDNNQARFLERFRIGNVLDTIRAKLSDNSKGFQRIAGYNKEKNILEQYFISEIKKEQVGEKADVPNSVLFFGPTGNGKTTFARAFASETGCKLVPLNMAIYSLEKSGELFINKIKKMAETSENNFKKNGIRTIIFIDEISKACDNESTILDELKNFLSNCSERYHCTVFATTNHPLNIALPLVGNESLFPYIVSMDPPNLQNKVDILKYYLQEQKDSNIDYNKLGKLLCMC